MIYALLFLVFFFWFSFPFFQEGKIVPLAPYRPKTPPPPITVTFKFNHREGGAVTLVEKEFSQKDKWPVVMEAAEALPSDVNPNNLHLCCVGTDLNARNKGDRDTEVGSLLELGALVTLFDYKKVRETCS